MRWGCAQGLVWPALDPYLEWAESTDWRGFRRLMGQRLGIGGDDVDTVRVLVEAADPQAARRAMGWTDLWTVAPLYTRSRLATRHFVAELPRSRLPLLRQRSGEGLRWELSLPFRDAETVARAQAVGCYGPTRASASFRPERPFDVAGQPLRPGRIEGPVMAVVDFGCPFLHHAFDDAKGRTRIRAIWDQGAAFKPPPGDDGQPIAWPWADASPRLGYGRTLDRAAIEALRRALRERSDDESEAYRRVDYLIDYDDPRRRVWNATHGSHVTAMAAGWPDPLARPGAKRDPAAEAAIVFVQLPALTAADSGGGSLSAQVLDAVRFALDCATPDAQVVVNVSYGSFAGPHDASSIIVTALDELVHALGGRLAIVVGAGNGRMAACHVARSVRVDRSALLRIALDPGDFTDTFVETWFAPKEPQLEHLRARVRAADNDWSPWVSPGQFVELRCGGDVRAVARLSFQQQAPNGAGSLLLLALAPTARPADDDGPLAEAGSWQVEIALDPRAGNRSVVDFDSWIERDDPGWLGQGAQPHFEEQHHGDERHTLGSLSTGRHTIVAGGFRLSSGEPADYSAEGRTAPPNFVYGACEESEDLPHLRAAGVRNGDVLCMNGTSVAAPVVARRLLNHLPPAPGKAPAAAAFAGWAPVIRKIVDDEAVAAERDGTPLLLRHAEPPPR